MQLGFYFDQTRCMGCYVCQVACKDWHDIPAGSAFWIRVLTIEQGLFPHLFVAFFPRFCFHCSRPICAEACPAGAITKRADNGIVLVDSETCLGKANCGVCFDACPYGAPQFGTEENAKMQKCDSCLHRVIANQNPICVDSCPVKALDFGPINDLKRIYGSERKAAGFVYSDETAPCIVLRHSDTFLSGG